MAIPPPPSNEGPANPTRVVGHLLREWADRAVDPSRLQLDTLLTELVDRANQVLRTQVQLRSLLDAVVSISGDLSLSAMLERIVSAACDLVDAQYGALGVLSLDGDGLSDFITVGMSPEQIAAIGVLPSGRGILGAVIEQPEPLKLADLSKDARSHGFPPNHPPMSSFLGVPVRTRNQVFGNLYLTEKRGGQKFTEEDEELVVALASAAGAAIQNAQLYDTQRRRGVWLAAAGEVRNGALGGLNPDALLRLVVEQARSATDAEFAAVTLVAEGDEMRIAAATEPTLVGITFAASTSLSAEAISTGRASVVTDPANRTSVQLPEALRDRTGACLLTPFGSGSVAEGSGTLILGYSREFAHLADLDNEFVLGYASHVALALEVAARQQDRERLAVLEDRDRIARDLHDLVIQRLFAAGMTLQSTTPLVTNETAQARFLEVANDLDLTIRELRQAIYQLQAPAVADDFRREIKDLVDQATAGTQLVVRLHFNGPVGLLVPPEVRIHLLAVVREALSNTTRHASAHTVDISLTVDDTSVSLVVQDDGTGIDPATTRRSGLNNMSRRAHEVGGEFVIDGREHGAGTKLVWTAPI